MLQAQVIAANTRAEVAETQQQAVAAAAALSLSRARQELDDARAAQFVAEEAHQTADAAAKLLAQRITGGCVHAAATQPVLACCAHATMLPACETAAEVQREAAQQQGVADATKRELSGRMDSLMQQAELSRQPQQSWQFRQIEALTRAVERVDRLDTRLQAGGSAAAIMAAVERHDAELHGVTVGLDECIVAVCSLAAVGSRLKTAIISQRERQADEASVVKAAP
jgi:hypothetical protein